MFPAFSNPPPIPKPWLAAFRLTPAELLCGCFKDGAQPLVLQILQAELQRVQFRQVSQFVHEGFAGEVIRCGRQRAVRTLAQGRARGMKFDPLVREYRSKLRIPAAPEL